MKLHAEADGEARPSGTVLAQQHWNGGGGVAGQGERILRATGLQKLGLSQTVKETLITNYQRE